MKLSKKRFLESSKKKIISTASHSGKGQNPLDERKQTWVAENE
jgi:hypothetical protein